MRPLFRMARLFRVFEESGATQQLWRLTPGMVALACAFGVRPAHAAEPPPTPILSAPGLSLDSLVRMDQPTLEALYRSASPGSIPTGFLPGRAIPSPGSRSTVRQSNLIGVLWKGKDFPGDGMMVNHLALGVRAVRADVYHGTSWLDGGPAIVLDYANTSRRFGKYRDEMREISPGLYLGMTYERQCSGPKVATYYAVQAPNCTACGKRTRR